MFSDKLRKSLIEYDDEFQEELEARAEQERVQQAKKKPLHISKIRVNGLKHTDAILVQQLVNDWFANVNNLAEMEDKIKQSYLELQEMGIFDSIKLAVYLDDSNEENAISDLVGRGKKSTSLSRDIIFMPQRTKSKKNNKPSTSRSSISSNKDNGDQDHDNNKNNNSEFEELLPDGTTSVGPSDTTIPTAKPKNCIIRILLKEKKWWSAKLSTQFLGYESSIVGELGLRNLFGRCEKLTTTFTIPTHGNTYLKLNYDKPFFHSRYLNGFNFAAYTNVQDNSARSHITEKIGALEFGYRFKHGHSLSYNLHWRDVMLAEGATSKVMLDAGNSLKSSIAHDYHFEKFDDYFGESKGIVFNSKTELAGLGGNVSFLSNVSFFQYTMPLYKRMCMHIRLKGGVLFPLNQAESQLRNERKSFISDRFFLFHTLMRGFSKMGPSHSKDSLGGDAFWSAGVHVESPLGANLDNLKFQAFGQCCNIAKTSDLAGLRTLKDNIKVTIGAGLVYKLGKNQQLEANYCYPVRTHGAPTANWQFGLHFTL